MNAFFDISPYIVSCPVLGCVPAVHLFIPLVSFAVIAWAVVLLSGEYLSIVEFMICLALILIGIAVPLFGLPGMVCVLFLYAKMMKALATFLSQISPPYAYLGLAVGFGAPLLLVHFFKDLVSYRYIFALSYVLKLGVAFAGVMWLRAFIRKAGIDPTARRNTLRLLTITLLVLIFLMLAFRFNFIFNSSFSLYWNVLRAKMDTFILVFCVLLGGAVFFIVEEKKARSELRQPE